MSLKFYDLAIAIGLRVISATSGAGLINKQIKRVLKVSMEGRHHRNFAL